MVGNLPCATCRRGFTRVCKLLILLPCHPIACGTPSLAIPVQHNKTSVGNLKIGAGNVYRKEITDQQPHRNQEGHRNQARSQPVDLDKNVREQTGLDKIGLHQAGLHEIGVNEARVNEARLNEAGLDQVRFDQAKIRVSSFSNRVKL